MIRAMFILTRGLQPYRVQSILERFTIYVPVTEVFNIILRYWLQNQILKDTVKVNFYLL